MRTRSQQKQYGIEKQTKMIDETDAAIVEFKAGNISINDLYNRGTFERVGYWLDVCGIMNATASGVECGKLVRVLTNWQYLTRINYMGNSTVTPYLAVYYTATGERVEVKRGWTSFQWTDEIVEKLFHTEFIALIREHGSKYLNRKLDRVMRSLTGRYPDLSANFKL